MVTFRNLALGAAFGILASTVCSAAEPVKAGALDTQTQMNAVTEALQAVAPVEEAVKRYRLSHDGFPASNAEAGVAPPVQFASNSVHTITVGPDGVIDVSMTAASGVDAGVIRFRPDYAPQSGGGDVHWSCASASFANIGDLTGGNCEHTKMP
jgi:hypothetical protein